MRKCEQNGKIFCCSFALDSVLTFSLRAKRGCTWTQGRLAIKHSLLYCRGKNRLSPSSISVLFLPASLPLLLNALCNILIKKFLQSLLPSAGCWLIMRSHCARLDLVRWRIRAKERKDFRFQVTGWQLSTTTAALEAQDKQHTLFLPMPQSIMCTSLPTPSALQQLPTFSADATDLSGLRNDHTKRRNNLANWLLSFKLIVCAQIVYTSSASALSENGGTKHKMKAVQRVKFTMVADFFFQCTDKYKWNGNSDECVCVCSIQRPYTTAQVTGHMRMRAANCQQLMGYKTTAAALSFSLSLCLFLSGFRQA